MNYDDLISRIEAELMNDPEIQSAVQELKDIILARYPEARFEVGFGEEPIGVYITATVDVEDPGDVTELYLDRMVEMQVEQRLPVHVLAVQPMPWERRAANEKKNHASA